MTGGDAVASVFLQDHPWLGLDRGECAGHLRQRDSVAHHGESSESEHRTGVGPASRTPCPRTAVQTPRLCASRPTGPRLPSLRGGLLRTRLLLASPCCLSAGNDAGDQPGVLGAEVQGECAPRSGTSGGAAGGRLARWGRLGVRAAPEEPGRGGSRRRGAMAKGPPSGLHCQSSVARPKRRVPLSAAPRPSGNRRNDLRCCTMPPQKSVNRLAEKCGGSRS